MTAFQLVAGAWVIAAPWLLDGATAAAALNDGIVGTLVIGLSLPRGPIPERYGRSERFIR